MVALSAWGVFCAVMSGAMDAFGALLQKRVVDHTPAEKRTDRFMPHLLRNPRWLLGVFLSLGPGTFFILTAQSLIGPALVPGLTATGLIILAVGSVLLNRERLNSADVLGIALVVCGVSLLGYSNLSIAGHDVGQVEGALLGRLVLFTTALALCWLLCLHLARRAHDQPRGLFLAVSAGFCYALTNAWTLPLILTIGPVFTGRAGLLQGIAFVLACAMLVSSNLAAIRTVQEAYKFAPASKVQPVLQIPAQIAPILLYFAVYRRSGSDVAPLLIPLGVALVIASGFLLGRRVAVLQAGRPQEV
jgi:multidrug transporter EmrE-like cation transporter